MKPPLWVRFAPPRWLVNWLPVAIALLCAWQAHAQGAKPGEGILLHNRQFLFGFYEDGPEPGVILNTLEAMRTRGVCKGGPDNFESRFTGKEPPPVCELIPAEGMDDTLQSRATRIQGTLAAPMMRVPGPNGQPVWRSWFETIGFGFAPGDAFVDASGNRWRVQKLLLDEMILTGMAASRWHCEPRNQPIIEMQLNTEIEDVNEFCAKTNATARDVFDRLNSRGAGAQ